MAKIKSTDSGKEIMKKILSGKATLENPLYQPAIDLMDVVVFLKKHKYKVPKILEDFKEEIYQAHLKWRPFLK